MKIVDASYEILEPNFQEMSIFERLETCGRICYKSEHKITNETSIPFCKKMISNKHMSTMEMAVLHIAVSEMENYSPDYMKGYKYLFSTKYFKDGFFVISGSVISFLEVFEKSRQYHVRDVIIDSIETFLHHHLPELFINNPNVTNHGCSFTERIPYDHKHIAVRFIVNRAVTHEIVRHRPVTYLQESQRYCNYSAEKFGNEVTFINPKAFFSERSIEFDIWKRSCRNSETAYLQILTYTSPQAARTVLPNSCKTEIIVYTNTTEWEHIFKLRTPKTAEPSMREVMIPLEIEMRERGFLNKKV